MKHYIILNDCANEYECGTNVLGVAHSMEEAKEIFNEYVEEERRYAEEHNFEILDDCETVFDAGEDGYYVSNHTNLYIQLVSV